ncbi:MAG: DUF5071 domain-containing protein [Rhodobacteraceae bacterium]|nr:DUF5071 domain-containing protein [Paracoccaceae bacterium]
MTLKPCIPKDKFDTEAVSRAVALGYPAINPILPELLVWMQDLNWPVAQDLAPILANAGPEIAPALRDIIRGDDLDGVYFVIVGVVLDANNEVWKLIEDDVRRLADHPTQGQKLEELDVVAKEAILAHRV